MAELSGELPNERSVVVRMSGGQQEPRALLEELLDTLAVSEAGLPWVSPSVDEPPWVLYRVDDNGNEFEMCKFLDRGIAEYVQRTYETTSHKQTYGIRRAT